MDNFINILRQASTPKEGISSEDTYDNGAGFWNPLAWQSEGYSPAQLFPQILSHEEAEKEDIAEEAPSKASSPVIENDQGDEGLRDYALIENTYREDADGTKYATGEDGNTYTYYMLGDKVKGVKPLTVDEQKRKIQDLSGGYVDIDDSIDNPAALDNLLRAIHRVYSYGDGTLVPQYVSISDPNPGHISLSLGDNGALGTTRWADAFVNDPANSASNPDKIKLWNTSNPDILTYFFGDEQYNRGFHPGTGAEVLEEVIAHELGHTIDNAARFMPDQWAKREREKGEMPTTEMNKRYNNGFNARFERMATPPDEILSTAAKEIGKNVEDAAATISEYATEDAARYGRETAAEAYVDVLYNGDNASEYSKRIVNLLAENANKYSKILGIATPLNPFDQYNEQVAPVHAYDKLAYSELADRLRNLMLSQGPKTKYKIKL